MKCSHRLFVALLLCAAGGVMAAIAETTGGVPRPATLPPLRVEGAMPSLGGAVQWLNSPPLAAEGLRGKVVLIEFWTYSCINWRRTLPYVRAWSQKYKNQGLVVIGVHTPEFEFEKDLDNVRQATREMGVGYPVAIDSEHAIWRAFSNEYWPALYFVDAHGRIRHHQFGEGDYGQSERIIQQLLAEAGNSGVPDDLVALEPQGFEAAADWPQVKSPETYVGYERSDQFASAGALVLGGQRQFAPPARLALNQWALSGDWTVQKQAIVLNKADGRIVYRFHARDLNLVMGPSEREIPVRFRVLIDGRPPGSAHGLDVDEQGNGTAVEQRMYQLIRQPEPIADRQFEIEFLDSGVAAFDFTFG
jgi:thiol-disulfide isomerase/thioredoxin